MRHHQIAGISPVGRGSSFSVDTDQCCPPWHAGHGTKPDKGKPHSVDWGQILTRMTSKSN